MRTRIVLYYDDGVSIHDDVITWQTNVTANGGTYSDVDTNALNDFMWAIDSFTSKFARLNLGIGTDLDACCTPQIYIDSNGGAYDTPVLYTDTDYSRVNGVYKVTPSSFYKIRCGYIPSNDASMNINDNCMGIWSGGGLSVGWNNNNNDIYCGGGTITGIHCKYSSGSTYFSNGTAANDLVAGLSYDGFFVVRRTDANTVKLYKNASLASTATRAVTNKPTSELTYMEAPNYERKGLGYFVGYDLTEAEQTTLYNAWAALNTALGR